MATKTDESDVIQLTRQLVQLPSVNPMARAADPAICFENRMTDFLVNLFEDAGLRVFRDTVHPATDETPNRENVLAFLPGRGANENQSNDEGEALPTVLLDAHQDTVPVDGMTIKPFLAESKNGRIYGRGACDVKGGLAAMICAMRRVRDANAPRPNIVLSCTINEEFGFSGAVRLRELWQSGECDFLNKAPDAIVVAEPTLLDVIVAHKGVVRWRCHTHGEAFHSSAPENGDNAIYTMAHVVTLLEEYASKVVGEVATHPLVGTPTLNVGGIQGGISFNTVPDKCTIQIGRRLCPHESPKEARQHVIDFLKERLPNARIEHEAIEFSTTGLVDDHNDELATALIAAAEKTGRKQKSIGVQFATNAAVFSQDAIPTVVLGPGSIDQAHTNDEWIEESQLEAAVEVLVAFLAAR